jgi:hypothetical protein
VPVGRFPQLWAFTIPETKALDPRIDVPFPTFGGAAVVTACVILNDPAGEVLALKLESPLYPAVMECVPAVKVDAGFVGNTLP